MFWVGFAVGAGAMLLTFVVCVLLLLAAGRDPLRDTTPGAGWQKPVAPPTSWPRGLPPKPPVRVEHHYPERDDG